jgi:fluoroquinolone resistance protein
MDNSNSNETEYNKVEYKNVDIKESRIQLKEFNSCTFIKCNFNGTYFQRCRFRECTFVGCDLSLVNLKDSSFSNTRFAESKLTGINWTQSDWAAGSLIARPVNFQNCVLDYSSFMGLNLEKIIINHCIAHEVSFEDANMSFADCTGTDFANSRFSHTNLTSADFRGAKDYQIDPILNTLKKTKFSLPEAMSLLYNLNIILEDL